MRGAAYTVVRALHDKEVQFATRVGAGYNSPRIPGDEETFTPTPTTMSFALKLPATPANPARESTLPPYRLSANELRLRSEFVASFNDTLKPGWNLHIAVWDLTDELKRAGALPEAVVKRIKYIAAIPIAFHYRVGYKSAHSRLKDAVTKAISLSIAWYFADEVGDQVLPIRRAGDKPV